MPIGFSRVTIFNMAVSRCGVKSGIEDPDETSPEADVCRTWYTPALQETLEAYNWGFARTSEALSTHEEAAPTNRYAYRYALPATCVAPRYIENTLAGNQPPIPYALENVIDDDGNDEITLVTDQEDAVLIFTKLLTNLASWSMHATNTLSVRLGYFIAYELTGKTSIQDRLEKRFDQMILLAPAKDAQAEVPKEEYEAETLSVRN